MSLSTTANKVVYAANGATTAWPFAFPILEASHLSVIITDSAGTETTLSTSLYSVTGIGAAAGGSVTYPLSGSALAAGNTLTILRTVPFTQSDVLSNQGGYYPEVVEARLDKIYMALQQHEERMAASVRAPVSDDAAAMILPAAADRAGGIVGFDDDGNVEVVLSVPGGSMAAWFQNNLAGLESAAAVRSALSTPSNSEAVLQSALTTRGQMLRRSVTAAEAFGPPAAAGYAVEFDGTDAAWVLARGHGQCRLTKAGANLLLSPFNGNKIVIEGTTHAIASVGVTLAPTGAAPDTTYYIYLYSNAGTLTLEHSATAPETNNITGVAQKTGDATRALVGMARAVTGPAWIDTEAHRGVISWFNQQPLPLRNALAANRTTTSATYTEIGSSERIQFLCWSGASVPISINGRWSHSVGAIHFMSVGIDSTTTAVDSCVSFSDAGGALNTIPFHVSLAHSSAKLSEGHHHVCILGKVDTGATITWMGSATPGERTTLEAAVMG